MFSSQEDIYKMYITSRFGRTCCLEVERHQLGATEPHGQRVVVGRVQPLAAGVDPGQLQAVVLQELLALDLVDVLLGLGLGEGRHVAETGPFGADLCREKTDLTYLYGCRKRACSASRNKSHARHMPVTCPNCC